MLSAMARSSLIESRPLAGLLCCFCFGPLVVVILLLFGRELVVLCNAQLGRSHGRCSWRFNLSIFSSTVDALHHFDRIPPGASERLRAPTRPYVASLRVHLTQATTRSSRLVSPYIQFRVPHAPLGYISRPATHSHSRTRFFSICPRICVAVHTPGEPVYRASAIVLLSSRHNNFATFVSASPLSREATCITPQQRTVIAVRTVDLGAN
jgi:hypothetical protein